MLRLKSVSILLICLYLRTGEEMSEFNAAILQQVFQMTASFVGPKIVVGDWNMEPSTLRTSPWLTHLGLKIVVPEDAEATCRSGQRRLLDYAVVSEDLAPYVNVRADFDVPWDPHAGLRISMPMRPRSYMVPKLRIPKQLPKLGEDHLFNQELWKESQMKARIYIDKWSLGTGIIGASPQILEQMEPIQRTISKEHCQHSTSVEIYAARVANIPEAEVRTYMGRGGLPHASLKPAIKRNYIWHNNISGNVNLWENLETLLGWLVVSPGSASESTRALANRSFSVEKDRFTNRSFSVEKDRFGKPIPFGRKGSVSIASAPAAAEAVAVPAIGKLFKPIAQLRGKINSIQQAWRRDVAPNCPVAAWISWIDELTPTKIMNQEVGYSQERVATWILRAKAQKVKAIAKRATAGKESFKRWLAEDLSTGASAAHALVKDKVDVPQRSPDEARKAFESWAHMWGDQSYDGAGPFCWKQCLSKIVTSVCGKGSNQGICKTAVQKANDMEIVDGITLPSSRKATKEYPDSKAKGIDAWSTKFLHSLPDELAAGFVETLNSTQGCMCWPLQLLLNLLALIPKQQGGERPIAKTPTL